MSVYSIYFCNLLVLQICVLELNATVFGSVDNNNLSMGFFFITVRLSDSDQCFQILLFKKKKKKKIIIYIYIYKIKQKLIKIFHN